MAAPETQFQTAGLNIPYSYTPVETRLNPPIQLPGTGELWANVGKTAMNAVAQAGEMLQKSPLNPAVKEQMNYTVDQYKRAEEILAHNRELKEKGYLGARTTAAGSEQLSPAEMGQAFAPYFALKKEKDPNAPPEPPAPKHAPGTGSEPQVQTQPSVTTPYGGLEEKNAPPPASEQPDVNNPPPLSLNTQVPSHGGSTAALTAGDGGVINTGQPQSSDVEAVPAAQLRAQQQPSSIWSPLRPAPLAPPAPTAPAQPAAQPAAQPPAQSQTPAAATQTDQASMQQWQNQNAHPVMSSQDALSWMKNQTTLAQDATYLPMGGPNGSPAYAFHMKGGGQNIVPVSQMVQKGAGPLIAAQNTSAVISRTDQTQGDAQRQAQSLQGGQVWNPQQPSPGPIAPVGAPQVAQDQPPTAPAPSPAPVWNPQQPVAQAQPPSAPGGYDVAAIRAALHPYTAVESRGGPTQAVLTAQTDSGQPGPVAPRPDIIPLTPEEQALATPENIANARANAANARVTPNQPANGASTDGSGGDPPAGELGYWHLYRDDTNRTGELYAVRPGLTSLFKQQRYYLGSSGWQEYDLPTTNMRLNMEAEFGGGKGSVAGAPDPRAGTQRGIPGGKFPSMSYAQIANMSVPAMQNWLARAGEYHNTNGEPNSNMEQRLTGLADLGQRTQRLIDGNAVAERDGIPTVNYGREAQDQSHAAAERDKLQMPVTGGKPNAFDAANAVVRDYWDTKARKQPINKFSDYMEEQVKRMNDAEAQLPGKQEALQRPSKDNEGPSLTVGGYGLAARLATGASNSDSKSPHLNIERAFQGGDHKEINRALREQQADFDRQFEESYSDAVTHNYRLTPEMVAYHNTILHRNDVQDGYTYSDKTSSFRDKNGHLTNPFGGGSPSTKGQSPAVGGGAKPAPTPSKDHLETANNQEEARDFMLRKDPGTHFWYKMKDGTLQEFMVPYPEKKTH